MAVRKATRSNSLAQPKRRRSNPQPTTLIPTDLQLETPRTGDPQLKSELLEALRHLNRGFGVALSSLDTLQRKNRQFIFPRECIGTYRNQTEALRAQANRDLLRLLAGREEHDADRFGRLCGQSAAEKRRRRS